MLKKTFSQWLGGNRQQTSENSADFPWADLKDLNQLKDEGGNDTGKIQIIFKHSTRCGISSMMLRRFEVDWKQHTTGKDFFLLDLIRHRGLSNAVAEIYGVHHQSPQVLIVKESTLVASRSHGDICSLTPEEHTA